MALGLFSPKGMVSSRTVAGAREMGRLRMIALGLVASLGGGCASVETMGAGRGAGGDHTNGLVAQGGDCPEAPPTIHQVWGPFGFYIHPHMLTIDLAWFTR